MQQEEKKVERAALEQKIREAEDLKLKGDPIADLAIRKLRLEEGKLEEEIKKAGEKDYQEDKRRRETRKKEEGVFVRAMSGELDL